MMVVARKVKIDFLLKQYIPDELLNQIGIPMTSLGLNRVMAEHDVLRFS